MSVPYIPDVSRETMDRLERYAALLRKWNKSINLVSKASIDDLWSRHILDSAQVFRLAQHPVAHWVDLGSGGGFPGLVAAILGKDMNSPVKTTLVESDARKSAFLRTVIRETGAEAEVINDRIEKLSGLDATVLSARALTDLSGLLDFASLHLRQGGVALFPKGENWQKELSQAQSKWRFDHELVKSETETGPVILRITGVSRV